MPPPQSRKALLEKKTRISCSGGTETSRAQFNQEFEEQHKNKMSEKQPPGVAELVGVMKEVWKKEISKEYCQNLMKDIPRRMESMIKNRGGNTKYEDLNCALVNALFGMYSAEVAEGRQACGTC